MLGISYPVLGGRYWAKHLGLFRLHCHVSLGSYANEQPSRVAVQSIYSFGDRFDHKTSYSKVAGKCDTTLKPAPRNGHNLSPPRLGRGSWSFLAPFLDISDGRSTIAWAEVSTRFWRVFSIFLTVVVP